ncbi:unnamed protein product [Hermetia illucens]|uniref:Uncharacterized protein n=1 Tax=Hermetia illucens TaxID=343691 RepID=A0A7R8UI74_HERIL|nr:unnamed protein product [Hermetia illucens]
MRGLMPMYIKPTSHAKISAGSRMNNQKCGVIGFREQKKCYVGATFENEIDLKKNWRHHLQSLRNPSKKQ